MKSFIILLSAGYFLLSLTNVSCISTTNYNIESLTVQFYPNPQKITDPTFNEIVEMLEIVSTRFRSIYIPDVGATSNSFWISPVYTKVGLTPVAAATLNKKLKRKALTVTIGITIYNNSRDENELRKAIQATKDANNIFPGTVISLFMNLKSTNLQQSDELNWFSKLVELVKSMNSTIKIGFAPSRCYNYVENAETSYTDLLVDPHVLQKVQYFVCSRYPETNNDKMEQDFDQSIAIDVQDWVDKLQFNLNKIYRNVEVVLKTEWASYGKPENSVRSSVENMVNYWQYMNDWGLRTQRRIFMNAAFDRTYSMESDDPTKYYGWWERVRSNSSKSSPFKEKIAKLKKENTAVQDTQFSLVLIISLSVILIVQ